LIALLHTLKIKTNKYHYYSSSIVIITVAIVLEKTKANLV